MRREGTTERAEEVSKTDPKLEHRGLTRITIVAVAPVKVEDTTAEIAVVAVDTVAVEL